MPNRRRILVVPAIAVWGCLFAGPGFAASASILAGPTYTIPWGSDPIAEGLKPGWGVTVGLAVRLNPSWQVVGRVSYSDFQRDDEGAAQASGVFDERPANVLEISGGEMSAYGAGADLRFYPSQGSSASATHPYLLGGLGVSSHDYQSVAIQYQWGGHTWAAGVPADSGTNYSVGFGAGLQFELSQRFSINFEARYSVTFHEQGNIRLVPITLELVLNL